MATRPLPNETVELVEHEVAFQGYFRVGRYFFRHGLYQGGQSAIVRREVFERGHAAAVLPYDPRRDEVVLIRQFRAGAYVAGRHPWTWEIVAGIIEHDESPEELIRREAVEEAALSGARGHDERRRNLRAGVGGREHSGQGAAVRRGTRHAGPRRDRQRPRRDRPAVAGAASRRGAGALGLATILPSASARSDSILLSSRARVAPLMGYDRRSALSRALYAGAQVLFCSPTTLSS